MSLLSLAGAAGFLLAGSEGNVLLIGFVNMGGTEGSVLQAGWKSHPQQLLGQGCAGAHGAAPLCFSTQPGPALSTAGFGFTE